MIHELKIESEYFNNILLGVKRFEVRKDDRGYKVGDYLALNELSDDRTGYSGRSMLARVTYILCDSRFCKLGYVIMSLKLVRLIDSDEAFYVIEKRGDNK